MQSGLPTVKRRHRPAWRRFAALVEYEGGPFAGFQRQPDRATVEGTLIESLQGMGLTGGISFASRTDAGVHAQGQVIAFKAPATETATTLSDTLNARLPGTVRIARVAPAPSRFHPRWSALGKVYLYRLSAEPRPPPRAISLSGMSEALLREAIRELEQAPHLSGFTGAGAPLRVAPPLTSLEIVQAETLTVLRFCGPAFGRYAIRHMVASLVRQACGEYAAGTCAQVAATPPPYRGPRAPADGLTLESVLYPPLLDPFADVATNRMPEGTSFE